MKRFLCILLALMMLLSMTACGAKPEAGGNEDNPPSEQKQEQKEEAAEPGFYIQYVDIPKQSTSDEPFDLAFTPLELDGLDEEALYQLLVPELSSMGLPTEITSESDFDKAITFKEYCAQRKLNSAYPTTAPLYSRELSQKNPNTGKYKSVILLNVYNHLTEKDLLMTELIENGWFYLELLNNEVKSNSVEVTKSGENVLNMILAQAGLPDYFYAFARDPDTGTAATDPDEVFRILFTAGPPDKEKGQYVNSAMYTLGYKVGDDVLLIQCNDKCMAGKKPTLEIPRYILVPARGFEVYEEEYMGKANKIDISLLAKALENRKIYTK